MILRRLLWIDCTAGFLAGSAMLALSGWLAAWYVLPRAMILAMGVANLGYAAFSCSLARRAVRPLPLIVLLVAANATWAVLCVIVAVRVTSTASVPGIAHLLGEGAFVGGLAALEWRERERLRVAFIAPSTT